MAVHRKFGKKSLWNIEVCYEDNSYWNENGDDENWVTNLLLETLCNFLIGFQQFMIANDYNFDWFHNLNETYHDGLISFPTKPVKWVKWKVMILLKMDK